MQFAGKVKYGVWGIIEFATFNLRERDSYEGPLSDTEIGRASSSLSSGLTIVHPRWRFDRSSEFFVWACLFFLIVWSTIDMSTEGISPSSSVEEHCREDLCLIKLNMGGNNYNISTTSTGNHMWTQHCFLH